MRSSDSRAFSDLPVPPGEILAKEIEDRGMTQKELASRLERPAQAINEIIKAKKAITADTAIGLEKALGIEAHYWSRLEADYRMSLARNRERDRLAADVEWLNEYPIAEMIERGWIQEGPDKPGRLEALLKYLGVAAAEPRVYYRAVGLGIEQAPHIRFSLGALAVWLRKGELEAQKISTAEYDESAFRRALDEIKQMTWRPPEMFIPEMTTLCAEAGVVFCMVPELSRSRAHGATRWLTEKKALIQMGMKNQWADIFWFTFFHQACHLLDHRRQRRFVIDGHTEESEMIKMEAQADRFACEFLIPPEAWSGFRDRGSFSPPAIKAFARSVGVAPFIVVGRMQKVGLVAYWQVTQMKQRYAWLT